VPSEHRGTAHLCALIRAVVVTAPAPSLGHHGHIARASGARHDPIMVMGQISRPPSERERAEVQRQHRLTLVLMLAIVLLLLMLTSEMWTQIGS
jgi:hypothetical protein